MLNTGIIIEVTGNTAKVTQRPDRITSGTIGIPVQFTFDSCWDDLEKIAVFQAGDISGVIVEPQPGDVVPPEVLRQAGVWLYVGVYGIRKDGSEAIATIWANAGVIQQGANPDAVLPADTLVPWWELLQAGNRKGTAVQIITWEADDG